MTCTARALGPGRGDQAEEPAEQPDDQDAGRYGRRCGSGRLMLIVRSCRGLAAGEGSSRGLRRPVAVILSAHSQFYIKPGPVVPTRVSPGEELPGSGASLLTVRAFCPYGKLRRNRFPHQYAGSCTSQTKTARPAGCGPRRRGGTGETDRCRGPSAGSGGRVSGCGPGRAPGPGKVQTGSEQVRVRSPFGVVFGAGAGKLAAWSGPRLATGRKAGP